MDSRDIRFPPIPRAVRTFLEDNEEAGLRVESTISWRVFDEHGRINVTFQWQATQPNPFAD